MIRKQIHSILMAFVFLLAGARPVLAVSDGTGNDIFTGNVGIGTTTTAAALQVGAAPSIVAGSSPAAAIKGNLVVDGKIYGDGSGLTGVGGLSGLNAGYIPQASSSTTIVDSVIYQNGSNVGIGTVNPVTKVQVNGGTGSLATGLSFGDGDTGFFENADDSLFANVGSTNMLQVSNYGIGVYGAPPTVSNTRLKVNGAVEASNNDDSTYIGGNSKNTGTSFYAYSNYENLVAGSVRNSVTLGISSNTRAEDGVAVVTSVRSSTTNYQNIGKLAFKWLDNTHAVRRAQTYLTTADYNGEREIIRGQGDGSGVLISIGGSAVDSSTNLLVSQARDIKQLVVKGSAAQAYSLQEWQDSNATVMTVVDKNGNIGIGTNAPVAKLVVVGSGTTTGVAFQIDDNLYVPKVTVLDNGNVGIGTTVPTMKLQVQTATNGGLYVESTGSAAYGGAIFYSANNTLLHLDKAAASRYAGIKFSRRENDMWYLGTSDSDDAGTGAEFYIGKSLGGANPNIWINGSGSVGVGTTSPFAKLQVDGNIYLPAGLGNIGIGTVLPQANLEVGAATTIPAGSSPVVAVKGNLVVDGKIYGDGSGLTGVGGLSGLTTWGVPRASSSTTLVDSGIYTDLNGNVGIGSTLPSSPLDVTGVSKLGGQVYFGSGKQFMLDTNRFYYLSLMNVGGAYTWWSFNASSASTWRDAGSYEQIFLSVKPLYSPSSATPQTTLNIFQVNPTFDPVAVGPTVTGQWVSADVKGTYGSGDEIYNASAPMLGLQVAPVINVAAASTGSYTALLVNPTEISVPSGGANKLVDVQVGGVSKMVVTSVGNLGIGSTTPQAKLEIVGSGTTTGVAFEVDNSLYAPKVTVLDNGNVGVGTTVPRDLMEIASTTISPRLRLSNPSANNALDPTIDFDVNNSDLTGGSITLDTSEENLYVIGRYNNLSTQGNIRFVTGGFGANNPILSLEAKSNAGVGIWEMTPDALLEVSANGAGGTPLLMLSSDDDTDGNYLIVMSSGNVGVGTTAPFAKLEVDGNIYLPPGLGNIGVGTVLPQANLEVGAATTIPAGSSPVVAVKGNLVVDGKIYGDGSGLTGVGGLSGLNSGYIPKANSSTTIVDSVIYQDINSNIGVGTTAPQYLLDVIAPNGSYAAPLHVRGWGDDTSRLFTLGTFTYPEQFGFAARYYTGYIETYANNGDIIFDPHGTGDVIVNSGNLGVGTTVPVAKLNILASGSTTGVAFQVDNSLYVSKVTILDNGNVGVGTTAPAEAFAVGTSSQFKVNASGDVTAHRLVMNTSSGGLWLNTDGSGYYHFSNTNSATAFDIASNSTLRWSSTLTSTSGTYDTIIARTTNGGGLAITGNVGIGTAVSFAKLEVDGNIYIPAGLGNIGIGTVLPRANLEVGAATTIPAGSSPVAAVKGNLVVDGKIYGDGSGLTGVGGLSGLNAGYIPQASSSTTIVDSTIYQNGNNIGIGTSTPFSVLDVNGSITFRNASNQKATLDVSTAYTTTLRNNGGTTGNLTVDVLDANTFRNNSNLGIDFDNNGLNPNSTFFIRQGKDATPVTWMTIRGTTGNVGIGSTTPQAKLEVVGSGSTTGVAFQIDDSLYTPKFTVLDNGNVGIGLGGIAPASALQVVANQNISTFETHYHAVDTNAVHWKAKRSRGSFATPALSAVTDDVLLIHGYKHNGSVYVETGTIGIRGDAAGVYYGSLTFDTAFGSAPTEKMRITPIGNVGIGTTVPVAKLNILASGSTTGKVFEIDDSAYAPKVTVLDNGNVGIGSSAPTTVLDVAGNAQVKGNNVTLTINNNGGSSSSARLVFTTPANGFASIGVSTAGRPLRFTDYMANTLMTLDTTAGNLGIGTTIPVARLNILAAGSTTGVAFQVDDSLYAPKFTVLDNGNVGLGTTTPFAALHVGAGTPDAMNITGSDVYVKGNIEFDGKIYGDGSQLTGITATATPGGNNTNVQYNNSGSLGGSDSFVFDGTNVGIASTAPRARLEIVGSGTTTGVAFQVDDAAYTPRMTVLSGGNVGLGTANPQESLALYGWNRVFQIFNTNGGANWRIFQSSSTHSIGAGKLAFVPDNTSSVASTVVFTNAGNVGIGSYEPAARLDIKSAGSTTGNAFIVRDSTQAARVTVLDNGNVGIGSVAPAGTLEVEKTGAYSPFMVSSSAAADGDYFVVSSAGLVGIGVAAPTSYRMQLVSSYLGILAQFTGTDNSSIGLNLVTRGTGGKFISFIHDTSNYSGDVLTAEMSTGSGTFTGNYINFVNNTAPRLILKGSGNMGLGTSAPVAKLEVVGSGTSTGVAFQIDNSLYAPKVTVLDNGSFGLGTTSPDATFTLVEASTSSNRGISMTQRSNDNSSAKMLFKKIRNTSAVQNSDYVASIGYQAYTGTQYLQTAGFGARVNGTVAAGSVPADLYFYTTASGTTDPYGDNVIRMVVGGSGNVGMGTITPTAKLEVVGSGSTTGVAFQIDNSLYAPKVTVLDNGNVGIGTTAPRAKFEVNSTMIFSSEYDNGNSSTSKTIDWNVANKQKVTVNGNCTFTFTAPGGPANLVLKMVHDGTTNTYTPVWPAAVKWPAATQPTWTATSGAVDMMSCYYDGTNYYCAGNLDFR